MKKQLLLAQFASTPWALTPDYLALMSGVLTNWSISGPVSVEIIDKIEDDKQARAARVTRSQNSGAIAVIPVYGVLTQRPPQDISGSGGTSTARIAQAVTAAANDPSVSQILLDLDGPGGSVYGTAEAADAIYQARSKKPVIGIANSMAASATYWIGSQCSEFYCTPGGEVGSIGVYTAHQYLGEAMARAGLETTLISAGKFKTEGNPFEPLSEEAKAAIQSRVDDYYSMFINSVARGRGASIVAVKNEMGAGRMLGASEAHGANMIDGVMTFDALLEKMQSQNKPQRSRLAAAKNKQSLF
ncbi:MAG: S49 family peptidase [Negativicutes bacterium]|jgi:signal peptide peptidase SppA